MATKVFGWVVLVALVVGAGLLGGDAARAGEGDAAAAEGVWIYEVRVVRVDPSTKEGAEAPHPFASMTGSTVKTGWREALALLKQRGTTTILMDQNVTTMDGEKAVATSDRSVQILTVNFASKADEQLRATAIKSGCKLEVSPAGDRLRYALRVQWTLSPAVAGEAPEQFVAEWSGGHPALDGQTLVLHYREQVQQNKDAAARAVEIYGLVTGRFLAQR